MQRIDQFVLTIQPINRSTHNNRQEVHTEQNTGCPHQTKRQLNDCYTHCQSKHDFIKTDQNPFLV